MSSEAKEPPCPVTKDRRKVSMSEDLAGLPTYLPLITTESTVYELPDVSFILPVKRTLSLKDAAIGSNISPIVNIDTCLATVGLNCPIKLVSLQLGTEVHPI